ncbi:hypothetical protein [Methylocystis suflitae]|uniref:hypothetical protein n=1 Tax=Methylocystis suflitae TaxID=2951405 RepID=UPI00210A0BE6|nr:hypothetical protein [Methylocystis suflitae]MCQ4188049.1 hypothetical protein [Methylocystis suflitae]
MKTGTTRRALVAGIAATPVAGLPALADVVAEPDPIFDVIAEQRRCKARTDEVLASLNSKIEDLEAERDKIAVIQFMGKKFQSSAALLHSVNIKGALSGDEITDFFNAREQLLIHEAAFERVQDESGCAEAEDEFSERNKAYFDAEMRALATQPTTASGALALLAFVVEHLEGPHCDPGEHHPEPLLGAVRNALAVLQQEAQS